MSHWCFTLQMDCGLALLTGQLMSRKWNAEGPRLLIDVATTDRSNSPGESVFCELLDALQDHAFVVSGSGGSVDPVPRPWHVWAKNVAIPSTWDLLGAELALELWLLPAGEINDLDLAKKALEARRASLPEDVREALAYWLLSSTHTLGGRPDLKKSWRSDINDVLVSRSPDWTSRRRPPEPLLAASQQLLEELSRLRNVAVTLSDYDKLLEFLATDALPAPDAFRQAVWWEAGYQLSARGLHQEAGIATQNYRHACDSLLKRLPGLADGGIPGFGISVGQRAYYAGEFRIALEAYQKEWDSGSEQHRSRLKRLIANALSDLGALTAARKFAEEALAEQEIAGDPETFKTLGRCGEISIRMGDVDSASEYYRRSDETQQQLFGTRGVTGQTATYQGHAALLAGRLDEAASFYKEAHRLDSLRDRRLNAYAMMGEAALALRRNNNEAAIEILHQLERAETSAINGDALPCAIITLAAVIAGEPREKGISAIDALLKNNYMVEALVLLPLIYRQVGMASKALNRIADTLAQWGKALGELRKPVGNEVEGDPTPKALLEVIAAIKKRDSWQPLSDMRSRIFPVNLIGPARLANGTPN
jgi:tetratricopeptide (TPR) repeat protein